MLHLPRPYVSYSALTLWDKDKPQYREQYYHNGPRISTHYTLFGHEVHQQIEDHELVLKNHPLDVYKNEVKLNVTIDDVPVYGIVDLLAIEQQSFKDIKTGIRKKDGTPRWDKVEVQKLDQLPFYSLLLKEKYGKVFNKTGVIWLPTEWHNEGSGIAVTSRLRLTGEQIDIPRTIQKYERERMREWIVTGAREISDDYQEHNKSCQRCQKI